jgi:uncharacterized membrane protein
MHVRARTVSGETRAAWRTTRIRPVKARPTVSLGLVLIVTAATMLLGVAAKSPCAPGDWSDGRQYTWLCYSDIVPLLGTEQLAGGRLPYLDACRPVEGQNCDEYPVLSMYLMRAAAWFSGTASSAGYYYVTAAFLTVFALVTAAALYLIAGRRALWFALAPTLFIYGTLNWDLLAVMLATLGLLAFFARREGWAGVLLGLGGAAKLYPLLLAVPLLLQRWRDRRPDAAIWLGWGTAGGWAAANLPFILAAPVAWFTFFRFNSERAPDWDSLWFIACRHVGGTCVSTSGVNLLALLAFAGTVTVAWVARARREPSFARWTLIFPIVVLFLVTNKVYSPQYGVWLLPLFVLALPDLRAFVAFQVTEVAVFVSRFWFFGSLGGGFGTPQWVFEVAVLARTAVLLWCLVRWVRGPEPGPLPLELEVARDRRPGVATVAADGEPA